ncbi:MAG: PAS domain-containing protein, partial [Pseudomonadota bacterium]
MIHLQILELALGVGLFANGLLFLYQTIRILKNKASLKENDTNIEGVTFKDIVDKIPAHIYWKDLEGRFLGASELQYKSFGLTKKEYVGKKDFEVFSQKHAEKIVEIDREVLLNDASVVCEETVIHNKSEKFYLSHKIPLKNKKGELVALLGVSVDVTDARKQEIERKNLLESIIALMPGHIYWCDRNNVYQGCNDLQAKNAGLSSRFDMFGKRNYELPWNINTPEIAFEIDRINEEVMFSGNVKILEEPLSSIFGEIGTCLSTKAPLYDSDGRVVG